MVAELTVAGHLARGLLGHGLSAGDRRVAEMRSADTTAVARAIQLDAYRALAPSERLEMAMAMSDELMGVTVAGIRFRHPGLAAEAARAELHRVLGHPEPVR